MEEVAREHAVLEPVNRLLPPTVLRWRWARSPISLTVRPGFPIGNDGEPREIAERHEGEAAEGLALFRPTLAEYLDVVISPDSVAHGGLRRNSIQSSSAK